MSLSFSLLSLLQTTFHHLFPFGLRFPSLYFLSLPFLAPSRGFRATERAKRIELQCDICFVLFGSFFNLRTERTAVFLASSSSSPSMAPLIRFLQNDRWPPRPLSFSFFQSTHTLVRLVCIPELKRVEGSGMCMDIYILDPKWQTKNPHRAVKRRRPLPLERRTEENILRADGFRQITTLSTHGPASKWPALIFYFDVALV